MNGSDKITINVGEKKEVKKTKFKDGGFLTKKSLNKIKQEVGKRKLIIHRSTGVGKSYFASNSSDKIFLATKEKENEKDARKNN